MKQNRLENSLFSILKRVMLIVIGSGLITNALYIYGLAFYEGYVKRLGFEYSFFPISWDDAIFWTYHASRQLGFESINTLDKFTSPIILTIMFSAYLTARIWMELSMKSPPTTPSTVVKKINFSSGRKVALLKKNTKWFYRLAYLPVQWLLVTEKSIFAFVASYFFMMFLFFLPIFIFIWAFFPLIGVHHGETVAASNMESYKEKLCGRKSDYWSKCITLTTQHLKDGVLPSDIEGSVLLKNGNLLAVMTKEGPVTMTMPPLYFHRSTVNENFKKTEIKE